MEGTCRICRTVKPLQEMSLTLTECLTCMYERINHQTPGQIAARKRWITGKWRMVGLHKNCGECGRHLRRTNNYVAIYLLIPKDDTGRNLKRKHPQRMLEHVTDEQVLTHFKLLCKVCSREYKDKQAGFA